MGLRLAVLVLLPACGHLGFSGSDSTAVDITVTAAQGVSVSSLAAQLAFASLDPDALYAIPAGGGTPVVPGDTVLALPDASGPLTVTLDAVDALGRELTATASTDVVAEQHAKVSIVIGAELPAGCADGVIDNGESDVDCGGPCPACGLGHTCQAANDCISTACEMTTCVAITGPPTWLPIADMPIGRIGAGAALAGDGRVYVFGGAAADQTTPFTEVDIYDVATDSWSSAPPLGTATYRTGGVSGSDGALYAIGGSSVGGAFLVNVQRFAPGSAQWVSVASLPTAASSMGAALDSDGDLYAIGGTPTYAGNVAFGGAGWAQRAAMPTPRQNLAAAPAGDGTVLAIGGHDSGETVHYTTVEAYDPANDSWRTLPSLAAGRSDLAAALAPDGRVYAIDGYNGTTPIVTVEAYRPGDAAWAPVAPTSVGRDTCSATVASDGRVIVFGGKDTLTTGYATAEAYGPRLVLGASSGAVAGAVAVAGSNFAASAAVRVLFDNVAIELATTDASGSFATTVVVPDVAAGAHTVHAVDDKAAYPASAPFTVH